MPKLIVAPSPVVTSNILVQRWQDRRREILKTLSPRLYAEYRKLSLHNKEVKAEARRGERTRLPM